MDFQKDLSNTANGILMRMVQENRPLTKTELRKMLGCTFQTVSNNMLILLRKGLVEEHRRVGTSQTFILSDPSMTLLRINWRGEDKPLDSIVKDYASGVTPVANLSQYSRALLKIFSEMYRISADAIDDNNPRPISLSQTKELKATVSRMRTSLRQLLSTCDSMLENDNLWNPQEIVNALLIKPDDMTIEMARSIAGNISEALSGK